MPKSALIAGSLFAVLCTSLRAQSIADARRTVREATQAVEKDSAAPLVATWTAALEHDPNDRLASLGLATVSRLRFQYDDALRRCAALMAASAPRGDGVALYARLEAALTVATQSNPRAADTALAGAAAAAHAAHDAVGEAEMLLRLAVYRARLRDPAAGAAILRRVPALIPADDSALLAVYRCTAIPLRALPPGLNVLDAARSGATLARATGHAAVEATCLFELADALEHAGRLEAAIGVLDTLEHQVLPPTDRVHLAVVLQHRGDDERGLGDFGSAIRSLRGSIAAGEAVNNTPTVAFAKMGLAETYRELGDLPAATQSVEGAAALFDKIGDRIGRMIADGSLGSIELDVGDTAAAHSAFEAERAAAAAQSEWIYLFLAQQGLADVATREQRWDEASRWLKAAGTTIHAHRVVGMEGYWQYARGTLALDESRLGDAATDLAVALRNWTPQQHGERYIAVARRAQIDVARGDTVRAEQELTTASAELDQWRSTLQDAEFRVLAFQKQSTFGGRDPGVAAVIAAVAKAGRTAAAFELAERRRARELADRLERSVALGASSRSTGDGAGMSASLRPTAGGGALAAMQPVFPDDRTLLLEYVTGSGSAPTTLFAVTRRAVRAYLLPSADSLGVAVQRFDAVMESGTGGRSGGGADELGRLLLGPALADAGPAITRLVIVPDGVLHRTPFTALRVDGRYVVERFAVSTVPSALVAAHLWQRAATVGPAIVLAFGDARFPREVAVTPGVEGEIYRSAFNESGGLPRLPGSADEARVVAGFGAQSVVRLRDSASAAYLKRAPLASFRVIHLATHAIVDDQAATRTALALAAGNGESGFVTPRQSGGAQTQCRPRRAVRMPSGGRTHHWGRGRPRADGTFDRCGSEIGGSLTVGDRRPTDRPADARLLPRSGGGASGR